jgi:hypothetical protein
MTFHRRPSGPALQPAGTLALRDALDGSEPLARLMQRLAEARRRFDVVAGVLPPGLLAAVRPGPLDDDGSWSLLADHNAAAAKLRQCLPALEAALQGARCPVAKLSVRVQPRGR